MKPIQKISVLIISMLMPTLAWPADDMQFKVMQPPQAQTIQNPPLGRLFSQPIERNNLDHLRKTQQLKAVVVQQNYNPPASIQAPMPLPNPVTLQGYVKRSDGGKSTIWINNKPVEENSTIDDVNIGRLHSQQDNKTRGKIERLAIKIPANGKNIQLKAGQRYEPETNKIKEVTTIARENQIRLESSVTDNEAVVE